MASQTGAMVGKKEGAVLLAGDAAEEDADAEGDAVQDDVEDHGEGHEDRPHIDQDHRPSSAIPETPSCHLLTAGSRFQRIPRTSRSLDGRDRALHVRALPEGPEHVIEVASPDGEEDDDEEGQGPDHVARPDG